MDSVKLGNVEVSRFILGSNPFSGFSHQTPEVDARMCDYFSAERIKAVLRDAESLGITATLGRADNHIIRILREYWNEDGKLMWLAQTCPGVGPQEKGIADSKAGGAKACHLHGGYMDHIFSQGDLDHIPGLIERIKAEGMAAGMAAHNPDVILWAEQNLDVDYYMCAYYNSMRRDENPEHVHGAKEWFWDKDRTRMIEVIQGLSKPVIHFKVMAAGRNDPEEALGIVAKALRPGDATCVGIYPEDKPGMLAEDVEIFERNLASL